MNKQSTFVFLPNNNFEVKTELFIDHTGKMIYQPGKTNVIWKDCIYQHLYLLSSDEPKEGEWCYDPAFARVCKYKHKLTMPDGNCSDHCKKIIATTDRQCYFNEAGNLNGVGNISPSDIEYIISFHNSQMRKAELIRPDSEKGEEVDVEKLARKIRNSKINYKGNMSDWIEGFNYCQGLNADKKFTLEDMKKAIFVASQGWYMQGKETIKVEFDNPQDLINKLFLTSSQPKRDTVMVEYEEIGYCQNGEKCNCSIDSAKSCFSLFCQPKLKDGHIIIVRD